ncbi:MAG: 4-alpha-glucanotransferase [Oscillospiraceae bacterium]|nr:4-alpha-glucanotransferase [Oscillospiraceae bacterium]
MRKSGILMHITSLPNAYGVGSVGKCAYDFVDFLCRAGQSCWQILPLCPTGYGDSPYQSLSTFAGNPYLIDLDQLIQEGLLLREEAEAVRWSQEESRVDYGCLYEHRGSLLRLAFARFRPDRDFYRFVEENRDWLEDYALFMALKKKFRGSSWQSWSFSLTIRIPEVLKGYRQELAPEMEYHYFLQYTFYRQWQALRAYANSRGIRIIGDVPIYVPLDSADVWANPRLFQLDGSGRPKMVAGCPPDSFSADGQLWGNPLYDWEKMKQTGYDWWIRRLAAAARMYDVVRLDHFRGFESYWAIPAGDETAAGGSWQPGPGMDFVRAIRKALPDLDFIAEDLGYVTPEVRQLLEGSGYPGMKVMQFAFDSRETADYLPHTYPVNSVCYTGTHDNLTMAQWFDEAAEEDIAMAKAYLGLNQEEGYVRGMIRGSMASASRLCVIQMQDYLELGGQARMNFPGTLSANNWTWRAEPGFITEELTQRIYETTRRYGRL